jgi:hypothetical protein
MSGIEPFLWLIGAVALTIFICQRVAGDGSMDGDDSGGGD